MNEASRSIRAAALAIIALRLPLAAQDGATTSAPVFDLSPFEVVAADDNSYLAKNAVSATKFNTALKDIPISLQVMTESFMQDTFSVDLESAMQYAAAVNDAQNDGGTRETGIFSIRGFRIDRVKRDGVVAYYGQDMTNVARVEVMKGPASLLYGQTEPGGIINYVPKRPFEQSRYAASISGGSDGFFRTEAEATGSLLRDQTGAARLVYRLDASYEEEDGWKDAEAHRKHFISPVLEWRLTRRAKLTYQYERHNHRRVTLHGQARGSRFARGQWLAAADDPANPNDLKSSGSYIGGVSGYMLLYSDRGVPVLVAPDPQAPGKWKLNTGLPGVAGDPRWDDGNGHLREDSGWFVFNPSTATSSPVVLVLDELSPTPYSFAPEHPDDFNVMKRDFHSLDYQAPLPWEGWFIRVVGVRDNPTLDILESRHLPLATYSGDGVRYSRSQFSSTFFENKVEHYQINITGKWELGPVFNQTIIGGELLEDAYRNLTWAELPPPEIAAAGELVRIVNGYSLPYLPPGRLFDIGASFHRDRSALLPSSRSLINTSEGLYLSNLSSFWRDRIKAMLGVRHGRAYTETYAGNSAGAAEAPAWATLTNKGIPSEKYTPQYGLIYAPKDSLSFYVSYSESFWPTSTLLRQVNADGTAIEPVQPASPFEGTGKEAGLKIDLADSKLSGTIAWFEIERKNIITSEPSPDPRFPNESVEVQGASEQSQGIDIDLIYSPLPNLQFVAGYAYIRSEVALGVTDVYKDAVGVPEHNATLWSKYTFTDGRLDGLSVGLGVNYTGAHRLFAPLRQFLGRGIESTRIYSEDYVRFALMLSYSTDLFGHKATFSLNVKNLLDQQAYASGGRPIEPRQAYLTARYEF